MLFGSICAELRILHSNFTKWSIYFAKRPWRREKGKQSSPVVYNVHGGASRWPAASREAAAVGGHGRGGGGRRPWNGRRRVAARGGAPAGGEQGRAGATTGSDQSREG